MEISLKQLVISFGTLKELAAQAPDDAKLGYRMGRVFKDAESEYESFLKTRDSLLVKYGTPKEGTNEYIFEDYEKSQAFSAEIEELLNDPASKVQIWGEPWKLSLLEGTPCNTCGDKPAKLKLSGTQFALLDWLIVDG